MQEKETDLDSLFSDESMANSGQKRSGVRVISPAEEDNAARTDPLNGIVTSKWFRRRIYSFADLLVPSGRVVKVIVDPAYEHPILSVSYKDKDFRAYIRHSDDYFGYDEIIFSDALNKDAMLNRLRRKVFYKVGSTGLSDLYEHIDMLIPIPPQTMEKKTMLH